MNVSACCACRPEEGACFARAISSLSAEASAAVLRCWDATRFGRTCRCRREPGPAAGRPAGTVRAVGHRAFCSHRPEVAEGGRALLAARGLADRVEVVGGDFLEEVPPGGDLYVLEKVGAARLRTSRERSRSSATCTARQPPAPCWPSLRGPLPCQPAPSLVHLMNLEMLVELDGRERTTEEYAGLLEQAATASSGPSRRPGPD